MMIQEIRIASFVNDYHLHDSLPVDLSIVFDLYDIQFLPFRSRGFKGFIYREGTLAIIGVNANLDPYQRRMIIVHELVHDLMGDVNWLCMPDGEWWYRHIEYQTQFLTSQILIPRDAFEIEIQRGATLGQLQDIFGVPDDLLNRRYRQLNPTPHRRFGG